MADRPAGAPTRVRTGLLLATVVGLVLLAELPAWSGWLQDPAGRLLANPFTGGQVWAADVVSHALSAGQWPDPSDQAGFPLARQARFVGWAWLLAATLVRPLLSANAAVHLAGMVGPALGGAAAVLLIRRAAPGGDTVLQGAAGVLYGLAPVTLGAALSGQVENTQTWLLPLLLLLGREAPRRSASLVLVLVPVAWALGALTSPYLAMVAAFAAPWAAWSAWREGASPTRALLPLLLAGLGLWVASRWLALGAFAPELSLFRPSFQATGWPELWVRPLPVASVDGVLLGRSLPQVKAMVLHQPYLGLVLVLGSLVLGRQQRRWAPLTVLGVLLALGPRLAWDQGPVTVAGHELVLPAQLVRWLHLPLAHGGQYYRAAILAQLGLAGALGTARLSRGRAWAAATLLVLLGSADALRSVSQPGLPWPTWELPRQAWATLAADPLPGGVLNLPMESTRLVPNHPLRLAGHAFHGRPVSDLPRAWTEPPEDPVLAQVWSASLVTPTGQLPPLAALRAKGFRYVVLDLPAIPERRSLDERLRAAWGRPTGSADGLSWWKIDRQAPAPEGGSDARMEPSLRP